MTTNESLIRICNPPTAIRGDSAQGRGEAPALKFNTADLLRSSEEIALFLQRVGGTIQPFDGTERRQFPRYVVTLPSIVQQLDENLRPTGPCVEATAHNISSNGIGLIYYSVFTATFIAVKLGTNRKDEMTVLAKVLWCRRRGDEYDVGCRLVTV